VTPKEFAHATMLVSSLRTRLGHATALAAAVTNERDDLAKQLAAHVESLKLSNAQCGKLLVQNEQLTAELDRMKGDPLPIKLVGKLKDVETSNKTLHSELVEVRAALATVSEERDSLKRTLQEWEEAETEPHVRVDPDIRMGLISETGPAVFVRIGAPPNDDIADHVVPLCTTCHACGMTLGQSAKGPYYWCQNFQCTKKTTQYKDHDASPFWGPCKSTTPVRHE